MLNKPNNYLVNGVVVHNEKAQPCDGCTGPTCNSTTAWDPVCVPNGSCSAAAPACGTTTYGVDNCGNSCSLTGPACPSSGVWTWQGDSEIGNDGQCSFKGDTCSPLNSTRICCGSQGNVSGPGCVHKSGNTNIVIDPLSYVCEVPAACVPNGSCSAATPACDTTTTGVDNCGNTCSKVGDSCASVSVNGTCGTLNATQSNLCWTGTPDQLYDFWGNPVYGYVSGGGGEYYWNCIGEGFGTNASCSGTAYWGMGH